MTSKWFAYQILSVVSVNSCAGKMKIYPTYPIHHLAHISSSQNEEQDGVSLPIFQ